MRLTLLVFLFALLSGSIFAQTEDDKLNRRQRQHLNIFVKTQYAIREGKVPSDQIFKAFYSFIAASNKEAISGNKDLAQKLIERANKALVEGKTDVAQRLELGANLYNSMAKLNEDIAKAFETNNSVRIGQLISQYSMVEKEMMKVGAAVPSRDWLTPNEAEKLMVARARK